MLLRSLPIRNLLALSLFIAACDGSFEGDAEDDILGMWETVPSESYQFWVRIDSDTWIEYSEERFPGEESCYDVETFEVVSRDADEWVIRDSNGQTYPTTTLLDDNRLVVTVQEGQGEEVGVFERSDRTMSSFAPQCP